MNELIDTLHEGGYSCVIKSGEHVQTFNRRGVADLLELYTHRREVLRGALVADKVIGKGAAALMVLGGVQSVYADVISVSALQLFETHQVAVNYAQCVPNIINRTKDGICPVESLCQQLTSLDEMLQVIREFVNEKRVIL